MNIISMLVKQPEVIQMLSQTFDLLKFSKRERQIAIELLAGDKYEDVGKRVFITEKSVKFHVTGINKKLGVVSRPQLMARFYEMIIDELLKPKPLVLQLGKANGQS